MTFSEFLGLAVLGAGFAVLGAWLHLQDATAVERGEKRRAFRIVLTGFAGLLGVFVLSFVLLPSPVPPKPWQVMLLLLPLPEIIGIVLKLLVDAFKVRNTNSQRSPQN